MLLPGRRASLSVRKAKIGFWVFSGAAGWILAGYPLSLLATRARRWERGDDEPTVTVIVPTYSEFDSLPPKLASLADLDYPADRLEIVVAVDGNEELAQVARENAPGATVLVQPDRSGKPSALNLGLTAATGSLVLLTDAHNALDPGSLRAAVRHFRDPEIAAVTGRWAETGSLYDRYEDMLRRLETRSGSVAGVFGGFTLVRRSGIGHFPRDVINEDLWLLCRLVRNGGRVIYEPSASSRDSPLATVNEIERRTRIAAGRTMLLPEVRGLPPGYVWRLVSHKIGRLALPFLLLGTFLSSLVLLRRPRYRLVAAAQIAAYGLGAAEAVGRTPAVVPVAAAQAMRQFLLGNYAAAAGVIRGLRGRQSVTWKQVR